MLEIRGRVGAQVRPDPTDLVGVECPYRTRGLVGALSRSSNIVESVISRDGGIAWGLVSEGACTVEGKGGTGCGRVSSPCWLEEVVLRIVIRDERASGGTGCCWRPLGVCRCCSREELRHCLCLSCRRRSSPRCRGLRAVGRTVRFA